MKTNKTTYKISKLAFPFLGLAFLIAATTLFCPATVAAEENLNVPPEGFKALFNGKDFTGLHMTKRAKEAWFVEDGMLRSLGAFDDFTAAIISEENFLNFVFMTDYRMLTYSDSGIMFRGWPPDMQRPPGARSGAQVNLHFSWAVGQPSVFHFGQKNKMIEDQRSKIKNIRSEIGVWHTIKLTLVGRTLTVEHDGEIILDKFEYPEGRLSMEPSGIGLQKHENFEHDGMMTSAPIEFRNVFIKELDPVK